MNTPSFLIGNGYKAAQKLIRGKATIRTPRGDIITVIDAAKIVLRQTEGAMASASSEAYHAKCAKYHSEIAAWLQANA